MSIRKYYVGVRTDGDYDYEVFRVRCDKCVLEFFGGEEVTSFMAAVERKKEFGFKSRKVGDKWIDLCPKCQRREASSC